MMHRLLPLLALVVGLTAPAALAAPLLRADVTVVSGIVTVGDMFDDAGELADIGLFRAPLPGTTGTVDLPAVESAAARAGLAGFDANGVTRVRVARASTHVDGPMLEGLIAGDLRQRGIAGTGVTVQAHFDATELSFAAEAVDEPATLVALRYMPGTESFTARFSIAGREQPVDVAGRIELLVEVPHLVAARSAGTILTASDIEMRLVPLKFAETAGIPALDQLVGKQLARHSHAGLMLKASDVTEPLVVQRNSMVTVTLRSGPMTLTIKGQALNSASAGQPVQVLNPVSRRILHGIANADGNVGITSTISVAGL